MNQTIHGVWLEKMFDIIVEGHCRCCERPEKLKHDLNFENPLKCGCRCDAVEEALVRAGAISDSIEAQKKMRATPHIPKPD